MSVRPAAPPPKAKSRVQEVLEIGERARHMRSTGAGNGDTPLQPLPAPTPVTPQSPSDPAAIAEMQARLKAAREAQKAERQAQADAAKQLA